MPLALLLMDPKGLFSNKLHLSSHFRHPRAGADPAQKQGAIFCMAIPVGRVVASEEPVQCKAGAASSGEWLIRV